MANKCISTLLMTVETHDVTQNIFMIVECSDACVSLKTKSLCTCGMFDIEHGDR